MKKIALFYRANNQHLIERANALRRLNWKVTYLGFYPIEKNQGNIPNDISIEYLGFSFIPFNTVNILIGLPKLLWIMRRERFDVFYVQNVSYSPILYFGFARLNVIEHMGSDVLVQGQTFIRRIIYHLGYRMADLVLQDSKVAKDAGIKLGAPRKNNHVINVGIRTEIFNQNISKDVARRQLGLDPDAKYVLSTRSFTDLYNIDVLIDAAEILLYEGGDVQFLFAAHTVIRQGLKKRIKAHSDKMSFLDTLLYEDELPLYLRACDVFVSIPSSDSSPLSVYEALASGCTVLVSDLPWCYEKFKLDRDFITCEISPKAIADGIREILNGKKMCDPKTQEVINTHFTAKGENKKLSDLMNSMLEENASQNG